MLKFKSEEDKIRLDQYLIDKLEISRSKVQTMIKNKSVLVNGLPSKCSYKIKIDDLIESEVYKEEQMDVVAEDIPLDIVYEDEDVLIVNKENSMVVHPAVGNNNGTLVNGLLYHSKLSDVNGEFRPGIVHRIDAYTTGLLVVAKNNKAHNFLSEQFQVHSVHRKYVALVWGVVKTDTGTIDAPIGRDVSDRKKMSVTAINSKKAVTHFKVIERFKTATLIELQLETGRTHQIRVHMNYIKHPVVNDNVYGRRKIIDKTGQCLHAKELGFIHPKTKEYVEFNSELPDTFINIIDKIKEV